MSITQMMSNKLEFVRKLGLCPSILNLYVDRYSFKFLLNDMFAGMKVFLLLFPIAFSLAFFCGGTPTQGIISCAVAAIISVIFGGSKYQITSVALPVCVLVFEILLKYQYKGLFYTAVFASSLLVLFGILKISDVLKHISYAFVSALSVYVILSIIINQAQYVLGISSIQSSQSLLENCSLMMDNLENVTSAGIISAAIFIAPIFVLKSFCRGFSPFLIYLAIGCAVAFAFSSGFVPELFEIKTIGKEMMSTQSVIDNVTTMASGVPSQTFLANTMNYAFVIALIIACEACFCTSVSSSITGDNRLQTNIELVSSGLANFCSVACGGLFVAPNINFTMKNIKLKSKTIVPLMIIACLCGAFIYFGDMVLRYIPVSCVSSILIIYALSEFFNKRVMQYFDVRSHESYIFWITLILALYFGFIPATIVGFAISCVFFAERMVRIKDANVHTTRNHDSGAIEFMSNKNGFAQSLNIPQKILNKIEVVQVSNILFLNIAKIVEEALSAQGKFPSVLIIYFNNVPYFDGEAFDSLKKLVKVARARKAMVMVSGTNGMLLDILQQKASTERYNDAFGYIVPNFEEAIRQTVNRLK